MIDHNTRRVLFLLLYFYFICLALVPSRSQAIALEEAIVIIVLVFVFIIISIILIHCFPLCCPCSRQVTGDYSEGSYSDGCRRQYIRWSLV
jgi:hypothetical protein